MAIFAFLVLHWYLSIFCQTFFLHRYSSHRQFEMSKGWERFFHLLTYLTQGSSYLSPRSYAILHRAHHAYSDTPQDPHSPMFYKNAFAMMWVTKKRYGDLVERKVEPEARFEGGYPEWHWLDKLGDSNVSRLGWGVLYTLFYLQFATEPWMYLFLPIHWLAGPIQGAIVNWCGHKYGYRNFDTADVSRNSLIFDVVTAGELFQNNHHTFGQSPNFAARWFEIDPTYQVMRLLNAVGIIDMSQSQAIPKHLLRVAQAGEH